MPEIFRTSLLTDHPPEKLHLILSSMGDQRWVTLKVSHGGACDQAHAPVHRVTLPLALWPRFYKAVCCLDALMKPMPAPAYQARSCCSYVCPPPPETVVLEQDSQEQIHLCLQDRRGSTFLEIKAVTPPAAGNPVEAKTICIGPTIWSAVLAAIHNFDQIIAGL